MGNNTKRPSRGFEIFDQFVHPGEKGRDNAGRKTLPDLIFRLHFLIRESELFPVEGDEPGGEVFYLEFFDREIFIRPEHGQYFQKRRIMDAWRAVNRGVIVIQNKTFVFHWNHSTIISGQRG